jgi:hypothetical protein
VSAAQLCASGPLDETSRRDTDVNRTPLKNLGKAVAKERDKSKSNMTRLEESVTKQPKVVTAKMIDRKSPETSQVGRDAKTGRFIPVKEAKRRTKTAVVETINKKK